MAGLRTFQKRFIRASTAPGIDTASLSIPRGNGKSWLAGHLLTRVMDPSDPLFREATESVLCAASIDQARIVFRLARAALEPPGQYRFLDSTTPISTTLFSNARLSSCNNLNSAATRVRHLEVPSGKRNRGGGCGEGDTPRS